MAGTSHILLRIIFSSQRQHSTGFLGSSFGFGITPSGILSRNNVSVPVVSRYGREPELLIEGNDSTCPNIFSVFGSSESQRESITAQRSSDANFYVVSVVSKDADLIKIIGAKGCTRKEGISMTY